MDITAFEKKIKKEINGDLWIRHNSNTPDIASVYWRDAYIGVVTHPHYISQQPRSWYQDKNGVPFRPLATLIEHIKAKHELFRRNKQKLYDATVND